MHACAGPCLHLGLRLRKRKNLRLHPQRARSWKTLQAPLPSLPPLPSQRGALQEQRPRVTPSTLHLCTRALPCSLWYFWPLKRRHRRGFMDPSTLLSHPHKTATTTSARNNPFLPWAHSRIIALSSWPFWWGYTDPSHSKQGGPCAASPHSSPKTPFPPCSHRGRASPRVWRWAYRAALTCVGFPGGASCKESTCQCRGRRGCRFHAGRPPAEGSGERSSTLAGSIPWSEEAGGLLSRGHKAAGRSWEPEHDGQRQATELPARCPPKAPRLRVCSQLRAFSLKESCTLRLCNGKPHTTRMRWEFSWDRGKEGAAALRLDTLLTFERSPAQPPPAYLPTSLPPCLTGPVWLGRFSNLDWFCLLSYHYTQ